jgi:3-hydroxyisobutyrate dehydrogenase
MYTLASSNGLGREDDAGLVRIYLPRDSSSLVCKLAHTAVDADNFHSRVTVVLKLLEGIHLAAAIEAFAMAAKFGLDLKAVHEIISNAAGTSRSFENYHSLSSLSQLSERIKSLVRFPPF